MRPVHETRQGSLALQAEREAVSEQGTEGYCMVDLKCPEICKQDAHSLQGSRTQYDGKCGGSAMELRIQTREGKLCCVHLGSWGLC